MNEARGAPPRRATASASPSALRAVITTLPPSATMRSAMAKPIPRLAPVTTATWSVKRCPGELWVAVIEARLAILCSDDVDHPLRGPTADHPVRGGVFGIVDPQLDAGADPRP